MSWKLVTACSLQEQLSDWAHAFLVAAVNIVNKTITVLACVPATDTDHQQIADTLSDLLPAGLAVVGNFSAANSSSWKPSTAAAHAVPTVRAFRSAADTDELSWTLNDQPIKPAVTATSPVSDVGAGLHSCAPGFVPLRCHVKVQLPVVHGMRTDAAAKPNAEGAALSAREPDPGSCNLPHADDVTAAMSALASSLLKQEHLLLAQELDSTAEQPAVPIIINSSSSSSPGSGPTVGEVVKSSKDTSNPCTSWLPLQQSTSLNSNTQLPAPMFEFVPAQGGKAGNTPPTKQQMSTVSLSLDVLCFAPTDLPLSQVVPTLLQPALQQQLTRMQQQVLQHLLPPAGLAAVQASGQLLPSVRALHFLPPGLAFPITVCSPEVHPNLETCELKLMPRRQQLHKLLGLPDNVPMLKEANALLWSLGAAGEGAGEGSGAPGRGVRLRNVHEALAPPGFGGQVYLIDGAYEYYHYMQDKFNDNGWGCAYRSLQTIVSWFRLQKYSSKPVPGHRQIQEILVGLGDKEPSFVGSSNWIGAIELGYILDDYLGITCKVLTVNKGSDIPSHARALAQHFTSQGTPVMIGGGVLAYTLLGVAFNEDTGAAAFLILDPHYTGGEDLKKIVQGTWVAWKQPGDNAAAGGPLFVKDAFYNFLCPQRPRSV